MKRMVEVTQVNYLNPSENEEHLDLEAKDVPPGVEVYEINGPFFFGAADKFERTMREMKSRPKVLILRLRFVPIIDATGLRVFDDLLRQTKKDGTKIILAEVQPQTISILEESGFIEQLGKDNFCKNLQEALDLSRARLKS